MSEDLTSWLVPDAPVEKEFAPGKKAFFRRISAGERVQLVKGQKVSRAEGAAMTMEFDVAENMETKLMLVLFSVCKADGSRFFKNIEAVRASGALKIEALFKPASEVNKEDEDEPGKS